MECLKCKDNCNDIRWHDVLVDGKRKPIGGDSCVDKTDLANAMKHTEYFGGYYNNSRVQVHSYNHCFICGFANQETVKTV